MADPQRLTRLCGWLVCGLAVLGMAQADTPAFTEKVIHNFLESYPHGASPQAGLTIDPHGNLYGTTLSGGAFNGGVVFKVDPSGNQTVLYSFRIGTDGFYPNAGVIRDSEGNLYGTTSSGGAHGYGTVYKLDPAGHETVLYSFTGGTDGGGPQGVIRDSAGNLYGTTVQGGLAGGCSGFGCGVVYRLDPANNLKVLYTFTGGNDGGSPTAGLLRDSAGNLYGTTPNYGANFQGVVFKVDPAGHEKVLHTFTGGTDGGFPGGFPSGSLTADSMGNLYGTAQTGGANFVGVVFKLDTHQVETVLYNFTGGSDGGYPHGGLIRDSAGNLYGATQTGGTAFAGVVFKIDTANNETVLYNFAGGTDGGLPSVLIRDSNGNLYGTAFGGQANQGVVYKLDTNNQETVLCGFPSPTRDGSNPGWGLLRDSAGNLYGTTGAGGTSHAGIVYKIDTTGHETVLHNFTGGLDGGSPYAGLVADDQGNLYGTAPSGGSFGGGVVFKLDPAGNETVLYNFAWYPLDGGAFPWGGVIRDSEGKLFGTTWFSGANNAGVVYRIDPTTQTEKVLYTFTGGSDGYGPNAGLARDSAGNLYGTTQGGGSAGLGVVYKVNAAGFETVLHNFTGGADGAGPWTGVVVDPSGNVYGSAGGGTGNAGVVFKLDPAGTETLLHTFTGGADGGGPNALTLDSAGNIYGTTSGGGASNHGVVFMLDPLGNETVLYNFTGADGAAPAAGVIQDSRGRLYGTTNIGGSKAGGVVYVISAH